MHTKPCFWHYTSATVPALAGGRTDVVTRHRDPKRRSTQWPEPRTGLSIAATARRAAGGSGMSEKDPEKYTQSKSLPRSLRRDGSYLARSGKSKHPRGDKDTEVQRRQ